MQSLKYPRVLVLPLTPVHAAPCVINCGETQQDYVTLLKHKGVGVFEMPDM